MEELQQHFTLAILFAMAGGAFGAVISSVRERDQIIQFVLEAAASSVAAAAVAENYLPPRVWLCAISGIGVGMITGTAIDAASALAPNVVKSVLKGLAEKFLNVKE